MTRGKLGEAMYNHLNPKTKKKKIITCNFLFLNSSVKPRKSMNRFEKRKRKRKKNKDKRNKK